MEHHHPYVVSQDVAALTSAAGYNVTGRVTEYVYHALMSLLGDIFQNVEFVKFKDLDVSVEKMVKIAREDSNLMWQTRVYGTPKQGDSFIDISRAVKCFGVGEGQVSRSGAPEMETQLINTPKGSYVLVDDVIFSGHSAVELIELARKHEVYIEKIITGITIGEGFRRIQEETGVEVQYGFYFEDVVDEICERDFIIGSPLSGRAVYEVNGSTKPYVLPWGDPINWASIPQEHVASYSKRCIQLSIRFWEEVKPDIRLSELPSKIFGLENSQEVMVEFLTRHLDLFDV